MNLNPHIDVPDRDECKQAFARSIARFPWLQVEARGIGTHTGQGTSWAGGYRIYELIDPLSPAFGMTGRVAEAATEIEREVIYALGGKNRDNGRWW